MSRKPACRLTSTSSGRRSLESARWLNLESAPTLEPSDVWRIHPCAVCVKVVELTAPTATRLHAARSGRSSRTALGFADDRPSSICVKS